jgi:hypothetical protein
VSLNDPAIISGAPADRVIDVARAQWLLIAAGLTLGVGRPPATVEAARARLGLPATPSVVSGEALPA